MRKWLRLLGGLLPVFLTRYPKYSKMAKHPDDFTPEENYDYLLKLAKTTAKHFRIQYIVKGEENLPKGQVFFVSNHVSLADPITAYAIADRPVAFLAKKEIQKFPFFGKICMAMKCEFLDREDLRSQLVTYKNIQAKLKKYPTLSFYAFPEGTRSLGPDFQLAPFHPGTFKTAMRMHLPIIPIATWLTERTLDQHFHYHVYPVQVTYLKPILPQDYQSMSTSQVAALAQKEIEEELVRMKVLDRGYVQDLNHYSDKKTDKVLMHNHFTKKD